MFYPIASICICSYVFVLINPNNGFWYVSVSHDKYIGPFVKLHYVPDSSEFSFLLLLSHIPSSEIPLEHSLQEIMKDRNDIHGKFPMDYTFFVFITMLHSVVRCMRAPMSMRRGHHVVRPPPWRHSPKIAQDAGRIDLELKFLEDFRQHFLVDWIHKMP